MKIVYFAWLRDRVGVGEETVTPPHTVTDVNGLIEWLRGRSAGHESALADISVVRVAVNMEYVPHNHPVGENDEVAFFPPVTGG
jgi:sulfur-carrier protein